MAHELIKAYTRNCVSPRCIIKIDLQKVYDFVKWIYLEQLMSELGFPIKFTAWVMECIIRVNYTTVVNGEQTEPFNATKGLRKGYSMSPFLFIISMEYLSRNLKVMVER